MRSKRFHSLFFFFYWYKSQWSFKRAYAQKVTTKSRGDVSVDGGTCRQVWPPKFGHSHIVEGENTLLQVVSWLLHKHWGAQANNMPTNQQTNKYNKYNIKKKKKHYTVPTSKAIEIDTKDKRIAPANVNSKQNIHLHNDSTEDNTGNSKPLKKSF